MQQKWVQLDLPFVHDCEHYKEGAMATKKRAKGGPLANYVTESGARESYWSDLEVDSLGQLVHAVSAARAAVLFGHTRDGGALALTFFDGDERATIYKPSWKESQEWLNEQIEYWEHYVRESS